MDETINTCALYIRCSPLVIVALLSFPFLCRRYRKLEKFLFRVGTHRGLL